MFCGTRYLSHRCTLLKIVMHRPMTDKITGNQELLTRTRQNKNYWPEHGKPRTTDENMANHVQLTSIWQNKNHWPEQSWLIHQKPQSLLLVLFSHRLQPTTFSSYFCIVEMKASTPAHKLQMHYNSPVSSSDIYLTLFTWLLKLTLAFFCCFQSIHINTTKFQRVHYCISEQKLQCRN